jgi:hypothetical protein
MLEHFAGPSRVAVALAVLVATAPFAACGSSVSTKVTPTGGNTVPENYPVNIVESPERRQAVVAGWERLLADYGVAAERRRVPDLNPFVYTPHSFLGSGPIRLGGGTDAPTDERIRLLLRDFISKNADLLGVTTDRISLDQVTPAATGTKRYSFVQTGYAYPIAPPAGRLEMIVSDAGDIIQISDTAIPAVALPAEPRITREEAERRVVGTTFTYGDIAGRPQQVRVTDPAHVHAERLVVYPEETEAAMRIRLVWEVTAGEGLTWTVFVDAITGETVATRQNFQT